MCFQGQYQSDWLFIRHPSFGCLWLAHTARARVETAWCNWCNWYLYSLQFEYGVRFHIRHNAGTVSGSQIIIRSTHVQVYKVIFSPKGHFTIRTNTVYSILHTPSSIVHPPYPNTIIINTLPARIVDWLLSYSSQPSAPASKIVILSHTQNSLSPYRCEGRPTSGFPTPNRLKSHIVRKRSQRFIHPVIPCKAPLQPLCGLFGGKPAPVQSSVPGYPAQKNVSKAKIQRIGWSRLL